MRPVSASSPNLTGRSPPWVAAPWGLGFRARYPTEPRGIATRQYRYPGPLPTPYPRHRSGLSHYSSTLEPRHRVFRLRGFGSLASFVLGVVGSGKGQWEIRGGSELQGFQGSKGSFELSRLGMRQQPRKRLKQQAGMINCSKKWILKIPKPLHPITTEKPEALKALNPESRIATTPQMVRHSPESQTQIPCLQSFPV